MPDHSRVIQEQLPLNFRIDRYVSEIAMLLTRSQIKARNLKAVINGKNVKLSRKVKQGDKIELVWDEPPLVELIPQDIPLDIIYEDARCVVINKAQGMVVHPGAGNRQGTLANALYYRRLGGSRSSGLRPGIVHRLDKDTSGVIIASYDDDALVFLSRQFKERKVIKNYIALVSGQLKDLKGRIVTNLSRDHSNRKRFTVSEFGRNAITYYKVLHYWDNYSLVLFRPKTGRTHQLRVHSKHIGHPILGDPIYGKSDACFPTLMLHAKSLAITLPGETEQRRFSAPLHERFPKIRP
jgi:23S rRNA pseudouridine1911/1915/1917 synthase